LPQVDRIIVLTDGQVSEAGTYEELLSRQGAFASLIQTFTEVDDPSADGDDVDGRQGVLSSFHTRQGFVQL